MRKAKGSGAGVAVSAWLAVLCHPALADEDSLASRFKLAGFGTLGVVHSSEDRADYTRSVFKPGGAGYTDDWSLEVDSRLGVQISAAATERLSAVLQVIADQTNEGNYKPHVEWADIKYQFTPELYARIGRIVMPSFLVSDTRNVGYANPWVRPPNEVYSLVPVTTIDGIDVTYALQFGGAFHSLQATFGNGDYASVGGGRAKAHHIWQLTDVVALGPLTLRVNYQETHLSLTSLNALIANFRHFGAQGNALADKYDPLDKIAATLGIGASYDPGNWFVMGEWGRASFHSVLGKTKGWYVTGGYRWGRFTPYLTLAQSHADNLSDPGLAVAALPPSLAGPATGLNAALNAVLSSKLVDNSFSVGARWDFFKNFDLKLQFDSADIGNGSVAGFVNIQPGFRPGGKFNLFTATVDFVF